MPPKKERLALVCPICNKTFYRLQCQIKKGKTYCSRKCLTESQKHGSEIECEQCHKVFYRHFAEQDMGEKIHSFCSIPCYFAWRKESVNPNTYRKIGAIHEHRIVAEKVLGRKLKRGETVHHIDGNKKNNTVSNLVVFPNQRKHAAFHFGSLSDNEWHQFRLEVISNGL